MVAVTHFFSGFMAAATAVTGATVGRRAVINHDAVVGFPETAPPTTAGALYLKHKPFLNVFHGCVPFPAVDSAGNTGGGLGTSGSHNSGCSKNLGQVYARGARVDDKYGIMYSWYMPKDSPSPGLGHRHDWENIVVWLSDESVSASIVGMAVSQHGRYEKKMDGTFDGVSPLAGYNSIWPLNHQMVFTSTKGGQQPLIAWESLTEAARVALTNTDFGSANVPMKDGSFENKLREALV